jgi:uncharacterized membrane protein YhaH (DUF805 family)
MFRNPFSFEGRIRRTEYGVSLIIIAIATMIIELLTEDNGFFAIIGIAYLPLLWFQWAQGAKRCHDRGNSGLYQIIPFYCLWMLFGDSDYKTNEYGRCPK